MKKDLSWEGNDLGKGKFIRAAIWRLQYRASSCYTVQVGDSDGLYWAYSSEDVEKCLV